MLFEDVHDRPRPKRLSFSCSRVPIASVVVDAHSNAVLLYRVFIL